MKNYSLLLLSLFLLHAMSASAQSADDGISVCLQTISGRIVTSESGCPANSQEVTVDLLKSFSTNPGDKGPTGSKGFRGKKGERGDAGAQGDAGASLFETMPSLKTITGSIGGTFTTSQNIEGNRAQFSLLQSIHAVLSAALNNDVVIVASTKETAHCRGGGNPCVSEEELQRASLCTGSVSKPTAPPGKVCIYPSLVSNVINLTGDGVGTSGFELRWASEPSSEASTEVEAVWAYTAP